MPQNPKRGRGQLPFDDSEILKADDPRPQRVPQYPANRGRGGLKNPEEHVAAAVFNAEHDDQELRATYGEGDSLKPAFLYVERGPGAGQLVQLKPGPLVIGRASVSDLRLQHPSISRRHAQFKRIGEQFFVKDLGSQNGTYVNKDKIESEIEVFPGDLIAMGNALLKLRGPLAKGESLPVGKTPPVASKGFSKKAMKTAVLNVRSGQQQKSSSVVKVAIFAGAMGFGLAGVLAFAVVKGIGAPVPVPRPAVEKVMPKVTAPTTPDLGITMDEVKVKQNKQIDEAISKRMAEQQAAEKKAAAEKDAAAAEVPAEAAPAEKGKTAGVAKSAATAKKDEFDDEAPAKAPSANAKRTAILAAYEKGNAEGSLEAAKKAGDPQLSGRLQDFLTAKEAAESAVLSNNGGAAIKNFEKALKLDEELSSGWGLYGTRIRKQLANLYNLVGLQHLKNDNVDNAKIAFQAALKNDPEHEGAKAQLAKLGGSSDKKMAAHKPAEDDEEGEKPVVKKKPAVKKPAAEPKSRSQAIDDAFGD
jgi:pSer/pThr/pTyr-binding forkhead associated (FHA) protein